MVLIDMDNEPSRVLVDRSMVVVVVFGAAADNVDDDSDGISSSMYGDIATADAVAAGDATTAMGTAMGKSSYSIGGALGDEVRRIGDGVGGGGGALGLNRKFISSSLCLSPIIIYDLCRQS